MLVEMGCLGGIETSGSQSSQEEVCGTEEDQEQDGIHTHTHTHTDTHRHTHTQEYYSAIKRNEIGPFAEIWMDLESVIQNTVSQKNKILYMNAYI